MPHFADTLLDEIKAKGAPVCVGIDPVFDRLPAELREGRRAVDVDDAGAQVDAIVCFVTEVLGIVGPVVPCVKFQAACFERFGPAGLDSYFRLVHEARSQGLVIIGDVKRGDIGSSAAHYAAATLIDPPRIDGSGEAAAPDAITVNSYFGRDGLEPFVNVAAAEGKGVFALVRTSNPGGDAIQQLLLRDGRTVAQAVGSLVAEVGSGAGYVGRSGYSLLGAVVGATKPQDAATLRRLMPQQIFLVPGFGAQGGTADDVRPCFKEDGTGALITASRSITFAYEKTDTADWRGAIEAAAVEMKQAVAAIL